MGGNIDVSVVCSDGDDIRAGCDDIMGGSVEVDICSDGVEPSPDGSSEFAPSPMPVTGSPSGLVSVMITG